MDVPTTIPDLADALIYAYEHDDETNEEHDAFVVLLKQYATAIVHASTRAVCSMLGVDVESVHMLELTETQYRKLEESNMIDTYMDGKDETDD